MQLLWFSRPTSYSGNTLHASCHRAFWKFRSQVQWSSSSCHIMTIESLVTVRGKAVHLTNRGSNFVPRGPASHLRIDVCQRLLLNIKAKLVHASSQMREILVCLLLLEQDYSQDYSYTNECVEGQDILRALLNSLPLSHLFFSMPARPRDLHNRLLPLSGVSLVDLCRTCTHSASTRAKKECFARANVAYSRAHPCLPTQHAARCSTGVGCPPAWSANFAHQ